MGNRAVIQLGQKSDALGIYLHWNGGEESVKAFLDAAKQLKVRENDESYGAARLVQIIGNFFGGTTSLGIGLAKELDRDNGDNGTFIVENLEIVGRQFVPKSEQAHKFDQTKYDGVLVDTLEKNKEFFKDE